MKRCSPMQRPGGSSGSRKNGRLLSEEYKEDGIHVTAYVPVELFEELYR